MRRAGASSLLPGAQGTSGGGGGGREGGVLLFPFFEELTLLTYFLYLPPSHQSRLFILFNFVSFETGCLCVDFSLFSGLFR